MTTTSSHSKMAHPSDRVKCPECQVEFARSSLKRHILDEHIESDLVVCKHDGCEKRFKTLQNMKVHFEAEHMDKTYECIPCELVFDKKGKLDYHKRTQHTTNYHCPIPGCDEVRSSKKNIENHISLPVEDGGHGGVQPPKKDKKKVVANKRKVEEVEPGKDDPVAEFIRDTRDRLKDNVPDRICANFLCQVTLGRLSWGFKDGDRLYCNKHREDIPSMINISKKRICRYVGCDRKGTITIGGFNFCIKHVNLLKDEGLPSPEDSVKKPKPSARRCKADGCDVYSAFDNGQYCYKHSPTKISDDKRVCEVPGCDNKMRPNFGYPGEPKTRCKGHKEKGMYSHKLCSVPGCNSSASYGPPDGLPLTCVHHKGDGYVNVNAAQCAMACCADGDGVQAKFFHIGYGDESSEFYGKRICTFGRRVMIEDAIQKNDMNELSRLMEFYELEKVTTLNAQSAFRFECEKKYHDLLGNCVDIVFDGHVHEGPKTLWSKRPDIFYKFNVNGVNFGIHIEYDEMSAHEDDPVRLECIEENAGCEGRVYLIRVNGGHDTKNPACTRVDMANYSYYVVTHEGRQVASMVSDAVVDRIRWIEDDLGPCDSRPARVNF